MVPIQPGLTDKLRNKTEHTDYQSLEPADVRRDLGNRFQLKYLPGTALPELKQPVEQNHSKQPEPNPLGLQKGTEAAEEKAGSELPGR